MAGCLFLGKMEASTIFVGPPPASIQAAVNIAASGDTIQLSAGTYVQEVQVISKSLNIVGQGRDVTIIQAPSAATHLTQNFNFGATFWCIVMVDNQAAPNPQIVNISNLTVDGSNQQDTIFPPIYGSLNRFFAIGYHNASGTVQNVHTTNTRQTANFNELAGGGIVNASNSGAVIFNVTNCLIDFYQRQGIDCRGSTLIANISNSIINRGYFLTPNTSTANPNGIQFSGSTTGSIINNSVLNNIATVVGASATAILPFGAGPNLLIHGNTIANSDNGIAAVQCGNNLTITNNILDFTISPGVNIDEGIVVQDTDGLTTLSFNIMNNIPHINMDLISFTNQPFQLMGNQFIGSQTGLLVQGSSVFGAFIVNFNEDDLYIPRLPSSTLAGPIVTMNSDSFSGTLGYYIQEVSAPNDIWPSTATVSFDGLTSGNMTFMQFLFVLTKIFDKHNDPALGLVLDFIPPIPLVSDVMPSFGPPAGGNIVVITGSHFVPGLTTVNFGATPATGVIVQSDTVIIAIAPPGTGIVDVTVTTPNGTSPITPFDQYSYILEPPTLISISPNFGPTTGGTAVDILGTGFLTGVTTVFFGDKPAISVVVHSFSLLTAIAPPGTGVVDITIVTSMGQSAINPADRFTYIGSPVPSPLPPSHFRGVIKKNKFLNETEYVLQAKWNPSPSPNVSLYRIYKHGKLIEEIPAGSDLFFEKGIRSKKSAKEFEIAAVNSDNLESIRVKIRIKHE